MLENVPLSTLILVLNVLLEITGGSLRLLKLFVNVGRTKNFIRNKRKNILLKDPFYFYSQEEISIFTFAHKVFNFSISFLKIAQFFGLLIFVSQFQLTLSYSLRTCCLYNHKETMGPWQKNCIGTKAFTMLQFVYIPTKILVTFFKCLRSQGFFILKGFIAQL